MELLTKDDLSNKKRPIDQHIEVVDNQFQKLSKVASL